MPAMAMEPKMRLGCTTSFRASFDRCRLRCPRVGPGARSNSAGCTVAVIAIEELRHSVMPANFNLECATGLRHRSLLRRMCWNTRHQQQPVAYAAEVHLKSPPVTPSQSSQHGCMQVAYQTEQRYKSFNINHFSVCLERSAGNETHRACHMGAIFAPPMTTGRMQTCILYLRHPTQHFPPFLASWRPIRLPRACP